MYRHALPWGRWGWRWGLWCSSLSGNELEKRRWIWARGRLGLPCLWQRLSWPCADRALRWSRCFVTSEMVFCWLQRTFGLYQYKLYNYSCFCVYMGRPSLQTKDEVASILCQLLKLCNGYDNHLGDSEMLSIINSWCDLCLKCLAPSTSNFRLIFFYVLF